MARTSICKIPFTSFSFHKIFAMRSIYLQLQVLPIVQRLLSSQIIIRIILKNFFIHKTFFKWLIHLSHSGGRDITQVFLRWDPYLRLAFDNLSARIAVVRTWIGVGSRGFDSRYGLFKNCIISKLAKIWSGDKFPPWLWLCYLAGSLIINVNRFCISPRCFIETVRGHLSLPSLYDEIFGRIIIYHHVRSLSSRY